MRNDSKINVDGGALPGPARLLRTHTLLRPHNRANNIRGWIFFDGSCGVCSTLSVRWGPMMERRGFRLAAFQEPWVRQRLHLEGGIPHEFELETSAGEVVGGAEALLRLAREIWWARPLWLLGRVPGMRGVFGMFYRWIAAHRYRLSGTCGLEAHAAEARTAEKWLD